MTKLFESLDTKPNKASKPMWTLIQRITIISAHRKPRPLVDKFMFANAQPWHVPHSLAPQFGFYNLQCLLWEHMQFITDKYPSQYHACVFYILINEELLLNLALKRTKQQHLCVLMYAQSITILSFIHSFTEPCTQLIFIYNLVNMTLKL